MGFFSWDCKGCDQSVRSANSIKKASRWMAEVVVLGKDGSRIMGHYDGYGRVERTNGSVTELDWGAGEAFYHRTCWHLLGKPKYDKPSRSARDQGYFVGEYDPPEPQKVEDLADLKAKVAADEAKARRVQAGYDKLHELMANEVKPQCSCGRDERGISVTRRMAGGLYLRCADRECSKEYELSPEIQARIEALYEEHGFNCLREDHPMVRRSA